MSADMLINARRAAALALSLAALTASSAPALGASVYQHNQTDLELHAVTDGTSNTIAFGERRVS